MPVSSDAEADAQDLRPLYIWHRRQQNKNKSITPSLHSESFMVQVAFLSLYVPSLSDASNE